MQIESRLSSAHMSVFLFAKAYAERFVLRHATRSMMSQNQNSSVYYFNNHVTPIHRIAVPYMKRYCYRRRHPPRSDTFTYILRRIIISKNVTHGGFFLERIFLYYQSK